MQTIQPVRIEDVGDPTRRLLETAKTEHLDIFTMLTTYSSHEHRRRAGRVNGGDVARLESGGGPVVRQ
jgi:hypothetical protein